MSPAEAGRRSWPARKARREQSDPRVAVFAAVTERDWGLQVEVWAKRGGWLYFHAFNSYGSAKGFPDYVFVRAATGEVVYAELKSESGKLTTQQMTWRDALIRAGQRWYCWRPSMEAECKRVLGLTARDYDRTMGTDEDRDV